MLKKFLLSVFISVFMVSIICETICCATTTKVTEDNLNVAFQNLLKSDVNQSGYSISMLDNNIIRVISNEETYNLNYDLTDNPIFTLTIPIEEGMSYSEFEKKTDGMVIAPALAYIAVANTQGVDIKDASSYFMKSYIISALFAPSNPYTIIDDLNLADGVTIEKQDNPYIIYTSDFGDRVIEYVNNVYKERISILDDDTNSFLLTIEKTDEEEKSCKIVSTLSVNLDADFSKLEGCDEETNNALMNKDITEENADYVIKLKVGQKCNIECNEEITGYGISGVSCVKFNSDKTVMTATMVGKANGYLYVGENNIKKSIYIIVEENTTDETLEPITIKVTTNTGDNASGKPNNTQTEKPTNTPTSGETNAKNEDNTIHKGPLPQTGVDNIVLILLLSISVGLSITFIIKIKKNKDIK